MLTGLRKISREEGPHHRRILIILLLSSLQMWPTELLTVSLRSRKNVWESYGGNATKPHLSKIYCQRNPHWKRFYNLKSHNFLVFSSTCIFLILPWYSMKAVFSQWPSCIFSSQCWPYSATSIIPNLDLTSYNPLQWVFHNSLSSWLKWTFILSCGLDVCVLSKLITYSPKW